MTRDFPTELSEDHQERVLLRLFNCWHDNMCRSEECEKNGREDCLYWLIRLET